MAGRERIGWLDTGRVLAIFLIVAFHVAYEFTLDNSLRMWGFFGASLFFIMSGYSLARLYPKLDWFDLGWMRKRYARIAAVYYPAILFVYILFTTQVTYSGWFAVAAHFVFLDWLWPSTEYSIISPAWFIIPLVGFYILFPLLNRIVRDHPWTVIPAFAAMAAFRYLKGGLVDFSPLFFLGEFCFGIAMAHGKRKWALGGTLLSLVPAWFMIVPYAVFLALPFTENALLSRVMRPLAAHTFEIFLFHESFMKAALGKWSALGLGAAPSAFLVLAAAAVTMGFSRLIDTLMSGKARREG